MGAFSQGFGMATQRKKQDDGQQQPTDTTQKRRGRAQTAISAIGNLFGGSKKKGGPVRKTALYMLHKGEHVVPAKRRGRAKGSSKRTITKP